jgi:hypothetical protein
MKMKKKITVFYAWQSEEGIEGKGFVETIRELT